MLDRPAACEGCPCHPGTKGYNPKRTGPFVPPWSSKAGSLLDPTLIQPEHFQHIDLVIIGMAPSFREVDEGQPLVGPTFVEMRRGLGPLLDTIAMVKLNYTNCRTWKPGKTVDFINRDPLAIEAKACALRWVVPILRAMAEAESRYNKTIVLWVMGQKAFDIIFQGKYGTFSGSKGSRGARLNRRQESYHVLADRIETWALKSGRKKDRKCMYCQTPLAEPKVRMCPECRELPLAERKKKADELDRATPPASAPTDPGSPTSASPPGPQSDG